MEHFSDSVACCYCARLTFIQFHHCSVALYGHRLWQIHNNKYKIYLTHVIKSNDLRVANKHKTETRQNFKNKEPTNARPFKRIKGPVCIQTIFNAEIGLKTYITPITVVCATVYCWLRFGVTKRKRKSRKYIQRRQAFLYALFVLPKIKYHFSLLFNLFTQRV